MKIQYYTKDHIILAVSDLSPHLKEGETMEKLYDLGEDCSDMPGTLNLALGQLFPNLVFAADRIYDRPDGKYLRYKIVDSLGNIGYLKFIYR